MMKTLLNDPDFNFIMGIDLGDICLDPEIDLLLRDQDNLITSTQLLRPLQQPYFSERISNDDVPTCPASPQKMGKIQENNDEAICSPEENNYQPCTPGSSSGESEESLDNASSDSHTKLGVDFSNKPILRLMKRPKNKRNSRKCDKVVKRSEKVWEFLLHLLQDKKTCPDLIRWEDFDEGTFRFVQSDKVARIWGGRKKNENMTYEKFSRAMRYYYKSKVLLPVPGRRLVYKFGPEAKGWQAVQPII